MDVLRPSVRSGFAGVKELMMLEMLKLRFPKPKIKEIS